MSDDQQVKAIRGLALYGSLAVGALVCIVTLARGAEDARVQHLFVPTVIMSCAGLLGGLVLPARYGKRAGTLQLALGITCFSLGWHLFASAIFFLSLAQALGGLSVLHLVGVMGVGFLAMTAALEWRLAGQVWRRWVNCGRIDLAHGQLKMDVRPPGREPVGYRRTWIPVVAAFGSVCGVFLRRAAGADIGGILLGVLGLAGSFLMLGSSWVCGFGMFIRIRRWEKNTGRRMQT